MLSAALVDAIAGREPRVIVTMPPRHGKSEITSHYFPVWLMEFDPSLRVMLGSYEHDFAATWGRKARDTILRNQDRLRVRLNAGSSAADRWETTAGGGMVTAGVGGSFTGRGADVFVVDDPVKNMQDARSEAKRRAAVEWFQSVALTRLEPGGAIIVVMTRWHEDDLAGYLLREAQSGGRPYRVVHLPALAGADDALGRAPGEALWPERYDVDALAERRNEVGAYVWGALYQGTPAPVEGNGIWKRPMLARARGLYGARVQAAGGPPKMSRIVVGVDPPGSEHNECGIVVAGKEVERNAQGRPFGGVLDDRSRLGSPTEWAEAAVQAYRDWNADTIVAETNYGGDMVKSTIRQVDPSVPVTIVTATRGKRIRAEPISVVYEQNRVWHRAVFAELEDEMVQWHEDAGYSPNRLDALVWAVTNLRLQAGAARNTGVSVW